jgi:hypothetical protein
LFLVSGIWFSIALLWTWLSRDWLRLEHQAWGTMTVVAFAAADGLVDSFTLGIRQAPTPRSKTLTLLNLS